MCDCSEGCQADWLAVLGKKFTLVFLKICNDKLYMWEVFTELYLFMLVLLNLILRT